MMNELAISCKGVTKTYPMYHNPKDRFKEALHPFRKVYHEDFYALRDVSFDIHKGETVGIIGQNGAGKSTLLKIITGVLTPTSGASQVNGVVSSILELGTGFNNELTGIENIYVNSSLMGVSKESVDKKLDQIIAFADIGDHINQPVRGYSSGMFARLAFSIAISIDPDILIVDEALAVGDMNFQAKCMTAMKRIQENGTTILFVSHDISSVKSLCERAIYIKNGVLHAEGHAGEVAELYMREMREAQSDRISKDLAVVDKPELNSNILPRAELKETRDLKSLKVFKTRVAEFRYGSGGANITLVELLDKNGELVHEADFNEEVRLRIHIESDIEDKVSVNFQVFDDKKINIISGGCLLSEGELIDIKKGSRHIVDYDFRLPLQYNHYSIQATITSTLVENVSYNFIDAIPNAYLFKVKVRPEITLWSKVHVFPKLTVKEI
ncbi:ABC transporter ATP-binding protein [Vibrio tasmaniensis]|uniref:ABC transporter n=4 Tax=Vibrionaceae TaxID=641 RepID=A0A2N7NM95_9VIBR|nr:ABC transporter [Vibrio tasmaniensis]TKG28688.1 ABC transporter ATP-binding protein [Vibrio tasmaniensis]TKG39500.1 ABC transporter ATP-binding protein [Vibrio tasmaniensis]TKG43392.1 ABC transporter ATP-binding protein [Vibrio tasmaniensis]TKG53237.1 ABC transporter ATP-binding protein [Vibrio tasmaniensis]